jgi:YVTN family beta-propeller protein
MKRFGLILLGGWATALMVCGGETPVASRGSVLVVNVLERTLTIIDPVLGTDVARIPVTGVDPKEGEAFPRQVAASPDGRTAWVPLYSDSSVGRPGTDGRSITIVSLTERKVAGYVDLGTGMRPHMPAFGPKDGLLYVTTEASKTVTIIDPRTRRMIGTIPTGSDQSHGLLFSNAGTRLYTWNVAPGSISVLDPARKKLIKTISLGGQVQRLAISKDDRYLFASDQTKPRLIVIDTRSNEVTRYIKAPTVPYALAMSPDGNTLLCALPFRGMMGAVDPRGSLVDRTFFVLRNPQSIVFRPDGGEAYVSTGSANAVAIIDLQTLTIRKYIKVANEAEGVAWAPAVN